MRDEQRVIRQAEMAEKITTGMAITFAQGLLKGATPADCVAAAIAATVQLIAKAYDGTKAAEVRETFTRMFSEALDQALKVDRAETEYAEFDMVGVAKRVLDGIPLHGRELEYALAMKMLDREGKPSPHLAALAGRA